MRRIWVLHNPLSGRPNSAAKVEQGVEALARRGLSVRLERPTAMEPFRRAARAAIAAQADAVLVAGGDGSVGAIAAELAGSPVALGVLPVGTANVWAKELGLLPLAWDHSQAIEQDALSLLEGQTRLADMGRCNGHLFLLWAGAGLDAFIMERLNTQRWIARHLGLLYNTAAAFVMAYQWRGADMRVVVGEREVSGHYLLAAISNINWYGGGLLNFRHGARLDDGQMDVWLFEGGTYAEALAHAARLFRGQHEGHPGVTHLTGDRVDIYTSRPQAIQIDGEPLARADHMSVQVIPQILRVLLPSKSLDKLFSPEGR